MLNLPVLAKALQANPISIEHGTRIYFRALQQLLRDGCRDQTPDDISLEHLRRAVSRQGPGACIMHPDYIEDLFRVMTLDLYQTIDSLYCRRLNRNIRTIWSIVQRTADRQTAMELRYEAVWAICLYLETRRAQITAVDCQRQNWRWILAPLQSRIPVPGSRRSQFLAVCLLDETERIIAFRIGEPAEQHRLTQLALYDALVDTRYPAPQAAAGLCWPLPAEICLDAPSAEMVAACAALDIPIAPLPGRPARLARIEGYWDRELARFSIHRERVALLFDNYLRKTFGASPLDTRRSHTRSYAASTGYRRDPGWQFPALRTLLPASPVRVATPGYVEHGGRQYHDPLLRYWIGESLAIRRSEWDPFRAWIYQGTSALCEARVR